MVVSTAASSQKTKCSKSASVSSACHSIHSWRAAWTSARCCSPAESVFTGQAELLQGAADGGLRAGDAEAVAELGQGEVGLGGEQLADFVVTLGRDGGLAPAGVGAWLERAGLGAQ